MMVMVMVMVVVGVMMMAVVMMMVVAKVWERPKRIRSRECMKRYGERGGRPSIGRVGGESTATLFVESQPSS